jgi:mRNA interferase MazF
MNYEIKRGDIFYIDRGWNYGHEQQSGRPGIIVSNDNGNATSPTVEVVYMTTQPKKDMPTHVKVFSTGIESTALCEQVHTVDVERLGSFKATCTEKEMQAIDIALMVSLGIDDLMPSEKVVEVIKEVEVVKEVPVQSNEQLVACQAKLDMVQMMYDNLLKQVMGSRVS